MNPVVIGIGILCALMLAAGVAALFSLWRAHVLIHELQERTADRERDNHDLTAHLESLAARVQELECAPAPATTAPAVPRAGMNLNKRSQVLRLHRQGDPPGQIATRLELPRQEVDLLIKVHRIVIANV